MNTDFGSSKSGMATAQPLSSSGAANNTDDAAAREPEETS